MNNKKAITIVILLGLEMVMYSLRFVNLSSESKLLPSDEVKKFISDKNMFDKLNGSCVSVGNFNTNQGVFLNSENINGYNPIFPKRLLKIVNAAEDRDPNWVETVSLNMKNVNGSIFNLAGVNDCDDKASSPRKQTPNDNIFLGLEYLDDDSFYTAIKEKADLVKGGKVVLLDSDRQYEPQALKQNCPDQIKPNVEIVNTNEVKISSKCDFYYVNPYLYYPGWVAIDGKNKSRAFPAFGYLQGYRITAGSKQVKFVYFPSP